MPSPENWRLKNERYALKCEQSADSSMTSFPPRPITPRPVTPYAFDNQEQYVWAIVKEKENVLHENE